jgi:hypothetical protein
VVFCFKTIPCGNAKEEIMRASFPHSMMTVAVAAAAARAATRKSARR